MTITEPGLRAATAHPAPSLIVLGHRANGAPIHWAGGGDGEAVTAGEDDDTDDDTGDDETAGETDEWTPPTREQWEAAETARRKANREAMERRRLLQEHGIDPRTGKKTGADDDAAAPAEPAGSGQNPADIKRALKDAADRAAAKTELRYKPALHKLAAKNALDDAGCDPGYRDLVLAGLDMSQVDVDDEGNVSGLDEQITDLKVRYPAVFKQKAATKRTQGTVPAGAKTSGADAVDGGAKPTKPAKSIGDWRSKMLAQAGIDGE
ncbi:phage scaffolding protein [Rhizomonospora bruguierae]|uniref:phage scaffolding protein n=1 Tax=Rhizomonospora bruguierae TaxID=1581705 RepID=UPI001BCFFB7D|nr:phage scaffolding protein [Micromonospora sp. NBRC 107566]